MIIFLFASGCISMCSSVLKCHPSFNTSFVRGVLLISSGANEHNAIPKACNGDNGYLKSRSTILDANITTLIAAFILFFMGSGPIKGFSITLGVGILTTLFSVYFIARLFTAFFVIKNKNKENLI